MADLMVALIGPGRGPNVPMYGREGVARVTGIVDGVLRLYTDGEQSHELRRNGNFELPPCSRFTAEYDGQAHTLIVEVVRNN